MEKATYTCFLISSLIVLSYIPVTAQISAGGGMNYDTHLKRLGFVAKLKYIFDDDTWAASPSYNIYPSDGFNPSDGFTVQIIDLDAHYHFATLFLNDVVVYGLGGIGIVDALGSTNIALNGGLGTNIPTDSNLNIFAELKFRVNKTTGTQINGGVNGIILYLCILK